MFSCGRLSSGNLSLRERNSIYINIYSKPLVASVILSRNPVSKFHKVNFTLEFPNNIQISSPATVFDRSRRNLTHHSGYFRIGRYTSSLCRLFVRNRVDVNRNFMVSTKLLEKVTIHTTKLK